MVWRGCLWTVCSILPWSAWLQEQLLSDPWLLLWEGCEACWASRPRYEPRPRRSTDTASTDFPTFPTASEKKNGWIKIRTRRTLKTPPKKQGEEKMSHWILTQIQTIIQKKVQWVSQELLGSMQCQWLSPLPAQLLYVPTAWPPPTGLFVQATG